VDLDDHGKHGLIEERGRERCLVERGQVCGHWFARDPVPRTVLRRSSRSDRPCHGDCRDLDWHTKAHGIEATRVAGARSRQACAGCRTRRASSTLSEGHCHWVRTRDLAAPPHVQILIVRTAIPRLRPAACDPLGLNRARRLRPPRRRRLPLARPLRRPPRCPLPRQPLRRRRCRTRLRPDRPNGRSCRCSSSRWSW
jgi:hypothetical protein